MQASLSNALAWPTCSGSSGMCLTAQSWSMPSPTCLHDAASHEIFQSNLLDSSNGRTLCCMLRKLQLLPELLRALVLTGEKWMAAVGCEL